MRILATGDTQTDFDNLHLCEAMSKEVLSICKEEKLNGVIFTGDLKRVYNPVDSRVVQFWMDFLTKLRNKNITSVIALGNHDRIGMYADAENWLSILAKAGAHVYDKPEIVEFSGDKLFIAPFSHSPEKI